MLVAVKNVKDCTLSTSTLCSTTPKLSDPSDHVNVKVSSAQFTIEAVKGDVVIVTAGQSTKEMTASGKWSPILLVLVDWSVIMRSSVGDDYVLPDRMALYG